MRRFVNVIGPSPIEEFGRFLRLSGEDPALFDEVGGSHDRRQTKPGEPGNVTADKALSRELIVEYQRRRNQNLWVLGSFYLIAPIVGILIFVIASIA